MMRTLAFVGRSPIDGVNYTSIGRNLGITKSPCTASVCVMTGPLVLGLALLRLGPHDGTKPFGRERRGATKPCVDTLQPR